MQDILFELLRKDFSEIQIDGFICIHDGKNVLYQSSDWDPSYPTRSLLKPIQFLTTGLAETIDEAAKLAACMGSLSALPEQVAKMKEWFKVELIEKVKAPACFPMDERARFLLREKGVAPSVHYQPCLGKHLGILQACENNGWALDHYLSESHPYHQKLTQLLLSLLPERKKIDWVTDGCLLPSPVLKLSEMARLYQKVAQGKNEFKKIQELMVSFPEWIGGEKRLDTKFVQINSKKVIAKEGADGLLGIALLPTAKYPNGLGIVSKIKAGYLPSFMMASLAPVFEVLGLDTVHEVSKAQTMKFHYKPFEVKESQWLDISPLINERLAVWPGDVPFKRSTSFDTLKGNHLTLSSIETTVHLGTHTDGLNHYEKTKSGIESADLSKYIGRVQVVEVKLKPKGLITPSDIVDVPITAERVLFKTGSFPNPEKFNEDFVALSKELIAYLSEKNVKLVGIDTPSIDFFESKELVAHHETAKCGMGILEGVVLDKVNPGIYFMSAVPLKIEGADASPVRVLLHHY